MIDYALKKSAQLFITVFGVVTLVFFTLRLIPGDAASAMAGDTMSGEALDLMREQMGLNEPLMSQYFGYLRDLVTLDLGQTITTRLPVAEMIGNALPVTLSIALLTIVLTGRSSRSRWARSPPTWRTRGGRGSTTC